MRQQETDLLHSWAMIVTKIIIRQIVFMRVMTLSNTNLVASRDVEREMD